MTIATRFARRWLLAFVAAAGAAQANTDIATVPLATSTQSAVLPNLMFVLDDSGSMSWEYMPDWATGAYCRSAGATSSSSGSFVLGCTNQPLFRSSSFNSIYYNPANTYAPPWKADGTAYPSQNSSNTSGWTSVKNDGYDIQSLTSINLLTGYLDVEWCTTTAYTDCLRNGNYVLPGTVGGKNYTVLHMTRATGNGWVAVGSPQAPTTQEQAWGPHYYTIVPGEYCTSINLRNCQASQSDTYNVPAQLRWCNSDANSRAATPAANSCQALKTAAYGYPRFPTKFFSAAAGASSATWYGSFTRTDIVPGRTYPRSANRSDCAGSACTYEEEMTNFANWWAYYHTRMQAMKSASTMAFGTLSNQFRIGYMSINNNTGSDFYNAAPFEGTDRTNWFYKLTHARPENSTPLRVALSTVGRLYAGKLSSVYGVQAMDPMQYSCQRNYTILSTDGYWNEATTPKKIDGSTAVGDQDSGLARPYFDGNATPNTLADVAAYYYNTDLRTPALANCTGAGGIDVCKNSSDDTQYQNMTTFTLGLGASGYMQFQDDYLSATSGDYFAIKNGLSADPANSVCTWQLSGACNWPVAAPDAQTAIDDLWHAAVNGHGSYFSARDALTMYSGLSSALLAIESEVGAGSAVANSNPNVSAGDNFVFSSSFRSGEWTGELEGWQIDVHTGLLLSAADWSAQALLDTNSTRRIFTFDALNAATHLKSFAWSSLDDSEKANFTTSHMTSAGALSQFCAVGLVCLSSDSQADAAGAKLVDFIRGDRSNEGSLAEKLKYYRKRTHVLGDIVDSQAVYVKAPKFSYADSGYSTFKAHNSTRTGMVYVGANDGMLHAFDAATGQEAWAYVPHLLLPKLYKLADKNYARRHENFVNASPIQGDISVAGQWKSILVGGLGVGGRGYYALDITDPADPKALWEFTDTDLGLTLGKPEITKLKNGTWVVLVASGYNNNVSSGDGRGYLYVLDAASGTVIRKIGTGAGSTLEPSGLAHIRAWADAASVDNTSLRAYGGDNLGNVWRFDINGDIGNPGYDAQLLATLRGDAGNVQPVTARPELGLVNGHAVVYVGTGRYLGVSDLNDNAQQSMYAIKDKLDGTGYGVPRASTNNFVKQTLTDSVCPSGLSFCTAGRIARTGTSHAVDMSVNDGWYVDLPANRERANTDPQLVLGTLAFMTNVPDPNACTPAGYSFFNFLDYRSGAPISTTQGVVSLRSEDGSNSLQIACTAGANCKAYIRKDTGVTTVEEAPTAPPGSTTRRTSWRELPTEQ